MKKYIGKKRNAKDLEVTILTKRSQTKMLHKQKGYTSLILHKFPLLNLTTEKYFHIFAITFQNKSISVVLVLIT